jgi:DNA transformation protein
MFGCVGLYCGQAFFGIIASDVLYFKVGDANRGDYEARGGRRFRPYPDRRQASMGYYEVPADVLEDGEECAAWAQRSVRVAHLKAKSPTRKPRAGRRRA